MKKIIGYGVVCIVVYYGIYETVKIIGTTAYKIGRIAMKAIGKVPSEEKKKKEEVVKLDIYETYFVD